MPTPSEYQKRLLYILEGHFIASHQLQSLLSWIVGERSYASPTDKEELIKTLDKLEQKLDQEQRDVKEISAALSGRITALTPKKKKKKNK